MSSQAIRPVSWSTLKAHSAATGIPAWRLAEDLGTHNFDQEELEIEGSVKVKVGGLDLDASRNK